MLRNISLFGLCRRTYEELDEVKVTAGGGRVERGPLLAVCRVHVRTKLNQHLRDKGSLVTSSIQSIQYDKCCGSGAGSGPFLDFRAYQKPA